jgi:hypothetical protein
MLGENTVEAETYSLYRGTDLLGKVVLRVELCDFPWYGGQFEAAPAFAPVEHLFKEELCLLEADKMDTWEEIWAQIEAPGLQLRPASGGDAITELIIHVKGAEATWRY